MNLFRSSIKPLFIRLLQTLTHRSLLLRQLPAVPLHRLLVQTTPLLSHHPIQIFAWDKSPKTLQILSSYVLMQWQLGTLLMEMSRVSNLVKNTIFKVCRWKNCSDGCYDAVVAPVWIALPKLPQRCWFMEFLMAIGGPIGLIVWVDHPTTSIARPVLPEFRWTSLLNSLRRSESILGEFIGKKLSIRIYQLTALIVECKATLQELASVPHWEKKLNLGQRSPRSNHGLAIYF